MEQASENKMNGLGIFLSIDILSLQQNNSHIPSPGNGGDMLEMNVKVTRRARGTVILMKLEGLASSPVSYFP